MQILSPAKINLFLQIIGKRQDGYHDLFSLMCCISLYDTISLSFQVDRTSVSCNNKMVPEDETNLTVKAANLFFKALNKTEHIHIDIDKQIPVGAGLGGGSSNAAAVLSGLNRYYDFPFSTNQLISMGIAIGSDVPFFIFRKPALVSGMGEKLESFNGLESLHILLIYPGFSVSTKDIYGKLNLGLTKCKNKNKNYRFEKQKYNVAANLFNDLETVAASIYPDIVLARKALLTHGAMGALMSGSGSTVFGLFSDVDKVQEAYDALSGNNRWKLFRAEMLI
ncbi:MAG: 4-(cytidine 5'-diphospho)-2-C-methyl-D-erythritol kinase [Deltaproteobacteria bacterium]|nr:4-(cytidine 5'-diphospho)-2-C-methyl-D-erythritol kinase [Deltaproteobacteria bacterium]MBW2661001.1 4-(cytidine 5'-diphospho)-2-C-methyl-D-erythritol kinase [Deltaproteobacteria bacterium]